MEELLNWLKQELEKGKEVIEITNKDANIIVSMIESKLLKEKLEEELQEREKTLEKTLTDDEIKQIPHPVEDSTSRLKEEIKKTEIRNLGETGFVFKDINERAYWCRMNGDTPWFMYWNSNQNAWVTLKAVSQSEIWQAYDYKISDKDAEAYHEKHKKFEKNE